MPSLRTARLTLYAPRLADLAARLAMDRDPRVMAFIGPVPEDAQVQRAEVRALILSVGKVSGGFFHVEETSAPGFLGWCGLFPLEDSGLIEIGYRFTHAAWGRGIATEAARAVLDHGFRALKLDPIVAVAHPENRASRAVLSKIGLRREGTAFHYGMDLPFYRLPLTEYQSPRAC